MYPPLMLVATFAGIVGVFLTTIAFLNTPTSIGTFFVAMLLVFPFYYAADAFEMYLMSRVAERAEIGSLTDQDKELLEDAEFKMTIATSYFRQLLVFVLLVTSTGIGMLAFVSVQIPTLAAVQPALLFALLALVILSVTIRTRKIILRSDREKRPEAPEELGIPHGEWQYAYQFTLDSFRSRAMRKSRPGPPLEENKRS